MASHEVEVSEHQQLELRHIAQSRSLPAGYVFRAQLILMLAEGASFRAIKQRLGTTAPTISRWKQRFRTSGIDGLDTNYPGQAASVLTPKLRGPDSLGYSEKAGGWLESLELPETCLGSGH